MSFEYEVERSDEKVDALIEWAAHKINQGKSTYPGMSYEEGVRAATEWLIGETDDHPNGKV